MEEPLLNDDQPSWVTLAKAAKEGESNHDFVEQSQSEIWNSEGVSDAPISRSGFGGGAPPQDEDDLPKIILFMRLGMFV